MIWLLLSTAIAATVDTAPSGQIVTVRPIPPELACIEGPSGVYDIGAAKDYWLVNPESWRMAVACGETKPLLEAEIEELRLSISTLTHENTVIRQNLAETTGLYVGEQATRIAETKELRKSRTTIAVVVGLSGLVVGGAVGAFIL